MVSKKIKVEVSAHHVHLCQRDIDKLFGKGYQLKPVKKLSQTGQYASKEKVLCKADKKLLSLRVLGPARPNSQMEISRTDAFNIGVKAPFRKSGDIKRAPRVELVGPKGKIKVAVIVAQRHIHCSTSVAKKLGLKRGDKVKVQVGGEKKVIFENVLIRVHDSFCLSCHLDTDEGNAAGLSVLSQGIMIF